MDSPQFVRAGLPGALRDFMWSSFTYPRGASIAPADTALSKQTKLRREGAFTSIEECVSLDDIRARKPGSKTPPVEELAKFQNFGGYCALQRSGMSRHTVGISHAPPLHYPYQWEEM